MSSTDISLKEKINKYKYTNIILKRKESVIFSKTKDISKEARYQKSFLNNIQLAKLNNAIIKLLFFIIIIPIINSQKQILLSCDSYITFKIKANGIIELFNIKNKKKGYANPTLPNKIEFKGTNFTDISFNYKIESSKEQEQKIKLIWDDNNKPISTNCLFHGCSDIIEIDLSNLDVSELKYMYRMFYSCSSLVSINLSNLNELQALEMGSLFTECSSLVSLDLSEFNTSNTISMFNMFENCSNLKFLNLFNFDTAKCRNMNYLFKGCSSLESLDLSNFNTRKVELMVSLFRGCTSLKYLNLSNFDTSQITNMELMFSDCSSLEYLDLSNFDTSKVETMNRMFNNCSSLSILNLTNFNTSRVKNMKYMFNNCTSLISLDISNFDTSNVENMTHMFNSCKSLVSLNLYNFDTSKVTMMDWMFSGCRGLVTLDISNFNTMNVKEMDGMFYSCSSLTSLNLSNFETSKVVNMYRMFEGCSELKILDISNFNTEYVTLMFNMFYNCKKLESLNLSHFNTSNVINMSNLFSNCLSLSNLDISNFNTKSVRSMDFMFNNCINIKSLNLLHFDTSNVQIMENMFANCLNLTSLDLSNFNTELASNMKKMFYNCSNLLCINLKKGNIKRGAQTQDIFTFTKNDLIICSETEDWSNLLPYEHLFINCLNLQDNTNSFKCYQNSLDNTNNNYICKSCCLNYMKEDNCPYYRYFSNYKDGWFCYEKCNDTYNKLIKEKNECTNDCKNDDIYIYELKNNYYQICLNNTVFVDVQTNQLINEINGTKLEKGIDEEIEEKNIIITLTTTSNQKNNENINKTTINLGECEYKLKWYYNISLNDSLYIVKFDVKIEGMKIPKIEYEVYYHFNSTSELTKLNLSICKDTKIELSIPVIINESLDKYNISSNYYNDICTITTSNNGTDITLSDRKNEFINNNMSLCEENCKLIEYNYAIKKAKCSCNVKINPPSIDKIKFDKELLKKSFIDINNMINFKIMKCYKNVFTKENLKNNIGFYINIGIFILFLVSCFIFIFKSFPELLIDINELFSAKKNKKLKRRNNNIPGKITKKRSKKENEIIIYTKENILNINNKPNSNNFLPKISKKKVEFNKEKNNSSSENVINDKNKNIYEYKDYELNSLDFEKALKKDKRNFLQYYISSIKINNLLLFSFLPVKDYNSMIIKIFLFFFYFALNLTVNALFFNDDTMHKIYIDGGKFDLIYQIPQIIYSSLISGVINILIKYLSLSQDNIMDFKHTRGKKNLGKNHKTLLINLKIKFILFFIVTTLFLTFFWYYISCFCGIYRNTQFHLMKDSTIGFAMSLFDPFWQCLFIGLIRIYALKNKKEYLYKFSLVFENLG